MPVGERGPGRSYRPEDPPPSAHGPHQPGIATPVLDRVAFLVVDLHLSSVSQVAELLQALTTVSEAQMAAHRTDSGRTPAGEVTITLGLGPSLFDRRFGLRRRRPVALAPLPAFERDRLVRPAGGDICLQICRVRTEQIEEALGALLPILAGAGEIVWLQRAAMVRRPSEPGTRMRPRNLLGFKEATGNPRRGIELDRHVWAGRGERTWMMRGTFLVARQVRIDLAAWRGLSLVDQEKVVGRHRESGAPLGLDHEFEPLPLDGEAIPDTAHVRLASARSNDGAAVLRRGYSYGGEGDEERGLLLLFYQRDPRRQFVPIQTRLDSGRDALNRFSTTVRSGVFAIPPGTRPGEPLASELFGGEPGRNR